MAFGQNFSIHYILGTSSSILLNFNPALIYLAAPLITNEIYSRKRSIGVLIATIGLLLVLMASFENSLSLSTEAFLLGNGLGFLSGVAWAGYSLSLRRFFVEWKEQEIEITALNLGVASIILFMITLMSEPWPPLENFTILSVWGIIVVGVGAAAIAFTLYLSLIQRYGTIPAGNIQFLVPLVSLIMGWFFLSEFSLFALIGGVLCALGVLVVTYERSDSIRLYE
jgi:drug/metabolite transporter (DMT)-like permease